MSPDRRILYEEIARINAERGTNLTVEGILRGPSKHDAKWVARYILQSLLLGALLFVAGLALVMGFTINASMGTQVSAIVIGLIILIPCFFLLRTDWRMIRDWVRENKAIEEMNRRVDARHTAREQGWNE